MAPGRSLERRCADRAGAPTATQSARSATAPILAALWTSSPEAFGQPILVLAWRSMPKRPPPSPQRPNVVNPALEHAVIPLRAQRPDDAE